MALAWYHLVLVAAVGGLIGYVFGLFDGASMQRKIYRAMAERLDLPYP